MVVKPFSVKGDLESGRFSSKAMTSIVKYRPILSLQSVNLIHDSSLQWRVSCYRSCSTDNVPSKLNDYNSKKRYAGTPRLASGTVFENLPDLNLKGASQDAPAAG